MADNSSPPSSPSWSLPTFYFQVEGLGSSASVSFQEVSGLAAETQPIEYRHSTSPLFANVKLPNIAGGGNVTLQKGIFANSPAFWEWCNSIALNTIQRRTVVIRLLDETGNATMTWTLQNAWPTKIQGTDMKSDSSEVAIETIELAYETLSIANS